MFRSRWVKALLVCGLLFVAALITAAVLKAPVIHQLHEMHVVWTVQAATLDYIQKHGRSPAGVDDLLQAGCLTRDGDQIVRDGGRFHVRWLDDLELRIPQSASGLELRDRVLCDAATGTPCPPFVTKAERDLAPEVNKRFATAWYKALPARQRPTTRP